MTRKATTFRLDPEVQAALAVLSDVQRRPQNQLVNEAVRELVSKRAREVEVDPAEGVRVDRRSTAGPASARMLERLSG